MKATASLSTYLNRRHDCSLVRYKPQWTVGLSYKDDK
jgi:hypothetical protein